MNIRDYLKERRLQADGAFGTYYADIIKERKELAEKANITHPETVKDIHKEYIAAGARLIRTNTFAANRESLGAEKEEQEEVLKAGYDLAAEAVRESRKDVFIAADIGPIPEGSQRETEQILGEYREMCDVFLKQRASVFIFETFSDMRMLLPVVKYIKQKSDAFIITQFSINRYGYTKTGMSAARILAAAAETEEIDGVGFNCGIGSGHLYQILKEQTLPMDKFLTAFPNSGYPQSHQDRTIYLDNHQYFAEKLSEIASLGIHIIGGCCGTTPKYIESSKQIVDYSPVRMNIKAESVVEKEKVKRNNTNSFYNKMKNGQKVIAVELDPPYDAKHERIMECANILKAENVDMITFADSPMGRGRVDSILMGVKVFHEVGVPVMPHIACRDKNAIALRAGILGGYMNHIRNLLIVTGDPIPKGEIKSVFDFHAVKLMEFIQQMNVEHFEEEPIYYGGAFNHGRANLEYEIKRMEKKIEAGASYFLTQPIFSEEDIERIRYVKERVDTKILCGIMPLISYRNAAFIRNEITGIHVPDEVLARYDENMTRAEGEQVGVAIAAEIMEKLSSFADGYYFMLPFNRVHLVAQCLEQRKR